MIGLTIDQTMEWKELLFDIPFAINKRKRTEDYVICVDISCELVSNKLRNILKGRVLPNEFGVYVSLVTDRDSDGVHLPEFISSFYHEIGGSLDFSFTMLGG